MQGGGVEAGLLQRFGLLLHVAMLEKSTLSVCVEMHTSRVYIAHLIRIDFYGE
jgi:hypothetical protein